VPGSLLVRERPSLRLNCSVRTPQGSTARWGFDDPNPLYAPKDLTFGTTMPGGFADASLTLERPPERVFADSKEMSLLTIAGNGGSVAWQGRIEKIPDTGGYQAQETIEAFGLQAALEDDNSAREIFIDREISRWEGAPLTRKVGLLSGNVDEEDATIGGGAGAELPPSVITQLTGAWARERESDAWYDAQGIPIGLLAYAWQLPVAGKIGDDLTTDPNFSWSALLSSNEGASSFDETGDVKSAGSSGTGKLEATNAARVWALLRLLYDTGPFGNAGVSYAVYWPTLAVYGRHGLPLQGLLSTTNAPGILASDAVGFAVRRWAPDLAQVVVPSTFVIDQLAFLEPTTVSEMIKQATRFELQDWAVWEGLSPTFYMNPRGERGRKWRARVGPAQLQEAGPQVSRLWNGVAVQYEDYSGKTRVVGPPGFAGGNAETEDPELLDRDPENPLNEEGIRKWALLKMGTASLEAAKAVGRIFLLEQATLELSGQATLVGHVEDEQGNLWPAWAVRSGDEISFVDAAVTSPRRIVNTSYTDSSRSNALQLEQPPDTLQAILERLSVALVPLGLS
jgi:hypothetical protein